MTKDKDDSAQNSTPQDGMERSIGPGPFGRAALVYDAIGWQPLPLHPEEKRPMVRGQHGYLGKKITSEEVAEMAIQFSEANLALRLGETVVCLDTDEYGGKNGLATLEAFEKKLGPLPPTYVSTSRRAGWDPSGASEDDLSPEGQGGIRFFRAPAGLRWKGVLGPGVDVITFGIRYAVVAPSVHPKTGAEYRWWKQLGEEVLGAGGAVGGSGGGPLDRPGGARGGAGGAGRWVAVANRKSSIPSPSDLPELPESWVNYLTNGKTSIDFMGNLGKGGGSFGAGRTNYSLLDMNSSDLEVVSWLEGTLREPSSVSEDGLCPFMRRMVEFWKKAIENDESSHDKILEAHWNLLCYATEGHAGWEEALKEIDAFWTEDVLDREKRSAGVASGETRRSYLGAARKLKAEVEGISFDGTTDSSAAVRAVSRACDCFEEAGVESLGDHTALTEKGNADRFKMLHGENARFAGGRWLFWEQMEELTGGRWVFESERSVTSFDRYMDVIDLQVRYTQHLRNKATGALRQASLSSGDLGDSDGDSGGSGDSEAERLLKFAAAWDSWTHNSLSKNRIDNSLGIASRLEGIRIDQNVLDANPYLLQVTNGVLELTPGVAPYFVLREPERQDYLTRSTSVPYTPWKELMELRPSSGLAADPRVVGVKLWINYLDTFLPDLNVRYAVQRALGYCLFGNNFERKIIFLYGDSSTGKSTITELLLETLGTYGGTVEMSFFKPKELNPIGKKSLGNRVVVNTEASDTGEKLSADAIKRMTGQDKISIEIKYSNEITEGVPAYVPIIATNHAPQLDGIDNALRKRVLVYPFNHQIAEEKDLVHRFNEIKAQCPEAFLAWLVDGWKAYCDQGFAFDTIPEIVETRRQFNDEMAGAIGDFLTECIRQTGNPEDRVTNDNLYRVYKRWAGRGGEENLWSERKLGREMKKAGFPPGGQDWIDGKVRRYRRGIRFAEEWEKYLGLIGE